MRVLVGVPTFGNFRFGYSIRWTLEALANQSFRDFRVLIVYRPSPGDRTLDVVDEFRDKLDIEVKIQSEGFFEEAMNIIFEMARDYDLLLITDDAIPSKTWVEDHVNFHKQFNDVFIARGLISKNWLSRSMVVLFVNTHSSNRYVHCSIITSR